MSKVTGQMSNVRDKGFTLVELLIYLAIIGMVIVAFGGFAISVSNSRNKTYVAQEVQANARLALDLISQKIRVANGINTSLSTFDTDPGYLSLSMASAPLNPTAIGLDTNDGILGIKEGASATTSITSDEVKITNLVFTDLSPIGGPENIKVEITVEFDSPTDSPDFDYSQSLQTAVSLRQ